MNAQVRRSLQTPTTTRYRLSRRRSRYRRGRRRSRLPYVLVPGGIALVMLGLAVWGYRTQSANDTQFAAHAVTTTAVIDSVFEGPPYQSQSGPPWHDVYAVVQFTAAGKLAHAQVTVVTGCTSACLPVYQAGSKVRIAYDSQNVSDAVIIFGRGPYKGPSGHLNLDILALAALGILALMVAVMNLVVSPYA